MSIARAALDSLLATGAKLAGALIAIKVLATGLGPEGMGQVGQFMSVVAILAVVTSGACSLGVTRLVAQQSHCRTSLTELMRTVNWIVVVSSSLTILFTLIWAEGISNTLFGSNNYAFVLRLGCIFFIPLGLSSIGIAIISGMSETRALAQVQVTSSIVGVLGLACAVVIWKEKGAVLGLLWMSACQIFFVSVWWKIRKPTDLSALFSHFDIKIALLLLRFSALSLIGILGHNFVQIVIRSWLRDSHGWAEVGYWQAMTRISDAYLQVINVFFVAYFLPRLVKELEISKAIASSLEMYRFIMPFLFVLLGVMFLFRDIVIELFLSGEFSSVRDLFLPQIIGDFFKIAAFIPGYLVIARGYMPLLFLGDPVQLAILLLMNVILIPDYGSLGSCWAYCVTYIIYSIFSFSILLFARRRNGARRVAKGLLDL